MSATAELRRMLDERGVEWNANDTYRLLVTSWRDTSGHDWAFMEHRDGNFSKLTAYHLTPAQAIAATLGRGTCKEVKIDRYFRGCSECGYRWEHMYAVGWQVGPKFCPNCGRKVVYE